MIERGEIVDFLQVQDESLVLLETRCLRLSPVPTAIVEYLTLPRDLTDLQTHLESVFGPAPQGRIQSVLAELAEQGVVKLTA